jgi:nicotinate phosphoribosyltransferase
MRRADRELAEGALFTDQYQLSMAQLYFREGLHERRAQFDYTFRSYPDYGRHQAGYCVFAGLADLLDWMTATRFTTADLDQLRSQRNSADRPVFGEDFLGWLEAHGRFDAVDLAAVPEGRVVHPYAPIATAEGPLAITQILETSLLNHLNYPTLVATKASRVAEAARGGPVLEFGLRRGPSTGANAGARAALVGGAQFTSNVGASHVVGVPPKGTHAHSMVQLFMAIGGGELEAFRAYARTYPDDCILLVDTIDSLESGVPNAIVVFRELAAAGHTPRGIRLDSGDLAHLAVRAAKMLDDAGFPDTTIVLSSSLDELAIWQILSQIEDEAPRYGVDPAALTRRLTYGVGTRLITSQGHSSLDGVYKLVAVQDGGSWAPAIKVSESREKVPIPGDKRVWRVFDHRGAATADVVGAGAEVITPGASLRLHHPYRESVSRVLAAEDVAEVEELVVPALRGAAVVADRSLEAARAWRNRDLERLDPGVRRLVNPHTYHVSLTDEVKQLQDDLIQAALRGAT